MLYDSGLKPFKHPSPYDENEKKYYSRTYRPDDWVTATEYKKNVDIVIPTTPNGLMYECISGGISGATEPTFSTVEGGETTDGTVKWKTKAYDLFLNTGDSITVSTWTGTNSETIDNESIIGGILTKFRLTAVSTGATSATIINHITVVRSNGDTEEFDRSIVIKVKPL